MLQCMHTACIIHLLIPSQVEPVLYPAMQGMDQVYWMGSFEYYAVQLCIRKGVEANCKGQQGCRQLMANLQRI